MRELTRNGHFVTVFHRCDESEKAIPEWSHLTDDDVSAQVVIPRDAEYLDYIDDNDADIIILGYAYSIPEFMESKIPVVLWEQGYQHIFGDYNEIISSDSKERLIMHYLYRAPVYLLAVSQTIRDVLEGIYNRESQLFPNGIDTDFYHPTEHKNNEVPIVLLVGNPAFDFKGFNFAVKVLEATLMLGVKFKVWWASQVEFDLSNTTFDIEEFIFPSQEKLAELYRNADVFVSTSEYESFTLPAIEAMASGTAVIATDNGGINTYAEPGINCLICEQGDLGSMSLALSHLLLEPEVRESLARAGRETALKYKFKNIVPILEQCLYRIVCSSRRNRN
jgi:glycosyltransferase involved in cell wall biosynthesis